jgi:hypothetical protein
MKIFAFKKLLWQQPEAEFLQDCCKFFVLTKVFPDDIE